MMGPRRSCHRAMSVRNGVGLQRAMVLRILAFDSIRQTLKLNYQVRRSGKTLCRGRSLDLWAAVTAMRIPL